MFCLQLYMLICFLYCLDCGLLADLLFVLLVLVLDLFVVLWFCVGLCCLLLWIRLVGYLCCVLGTPACCSLFIFHECWLLLWRAICFVCFVLCVMS